MTYSVELSPEAQKDLKALSGYARSAALAILRDLKADPRPMRSTELRGKPGIYRIWLLRKWRIVYTIQDELLLVLVLRVRLKEQIDYDSL